MMTRKGFFAMMAAAIAGTKVAPAARYAVVNMPRNYAMSMAIIGDAVNVKWQEPVRAMDDGNVEWSSAEYTINLRATGDGDMIDDSGNYWQIR